MALTYQLEGPLLRFVAEGELPFEQGLEGMVEGLSFYARVQPAERRVLFDLREILAEASVAQLRELVGHVEKTLQTARIALLVKDRDVRYGLARMCAALFNPDRVQADVYLSEEEAVDWLSAYVQEHSDMDEDVETWS